MSTPPNLIQKIRRQLTYYRALAGNARTPAISKWLIGIALAYLVSPIDIIPDFIPVVGHLDDMIVVPALLWIAVRLIPAEVKNEARASSGTGRFECGRRSSLSS